MRLKTKYLSTTDYIRFIRYSEIIGLGFGLLLTLQHIDGVPSLTPIIIVAYLLTAIFIVTFSLKTGESVTSNYPLLLFVAACALSLLIGKPEPLRYCWLRMGGFTIALIVLSPLVVSPLFSSLRNGIWKGWWTGAITLTALSFITLIVSISRIDDFQYFGFKGIMTMGMSLSPVAALTAIYSLYKVQNCSNKRTQRIAWFVLYCAASLTSIAGGSRIAIIGLVVSSAVILGFSWHSKQHKLVFGIVGGILLIGAVSFVSPQINSVIKHKTALVTETGSMFSSRLDKWDGRLEEFNSAPLTGIGFSAQTTFNSTFDNKAAILNGNSPEPGSSWLSLLAQTGILGTSIFLSFLTSVIIKLFRKSNQLQLAILAFLLLNGVSEGWLLYSNSILFPLFWTLTDCIDFVDASTCS